MEREIEQWDLSNPMEAFQVALFLFRLKRSEKTLLDKFEMKKDQLVQELATNTWKRWNKSSST